MINKFDKYSSKILCLVTFLLMFSSQFLIISANYIFKYRWFVGVRDVNYIFGFYVSIPILIIMYIYGIWNKKRKIDIFDYLFYALIIGSVVSTVFAVDRYIAFYGSIYRHEGLIAWLAYYLLFINWKVYGNKKDIGIVINMIIFIAVLNAIYGLLQVYTNFSWIFKSFDNNATASGLCGHPNFFGTLIATSLCLHVGKMIVNKKITLFNAFILLLLLISLVNCQSTGPIISFLISVIFMLIYFFVKRVISWKSFVIIIVLFLLLPIVYFASVSINDKYFGNSNCELCKIEKTIKNGGTGRTKIWENTIEISKSNIVNGIGYDNLYLVYPERGINGRLVDNAHNVYLHILVTTGILGFIPYMLLIICTLIKGIKTKNKLIMVLTCGFMVYSIQAITNLNVIQVAPIYFAIVGLIASTKD